MSKKELPEINASSMADIAFLLLTFFLIATSLDRPQGIQRLVPDPDNIPENPPIIHERNLLRILVNFQGQVQINGDDAQLADIKDKVVDFVDNGADKSEKTGEACNYCNGLRSQSSSTHPTDAIVSLELDRNTPYNYYITAQNQIDAGYNELLNKYAKEKFNKTFQQLEAEAEKAGDDQNAQAKADLEQVKNAYPKQIAEARPKDNNR